VHRENVFRSFITKNIRQKFRTLKYYLSNILKIHFPLFSVIFVLDDFSLIFVCKMIGLLYTFCTFLVAFRMIFMMITDEFRF